MIRTGAWSHVPSPSPFFLGANVTAEFGSTYCVLKSQPPHLTRGLPSKQKFPREGDFACQRVCGNVWRHVLVVIACKSRIATDISMPGTVLNLRQYAGHP